MRFTIIEVSSPVAADERHRQQMNINLHPLDPSLHLSVEDNEEQQHEISPASAAQRPFVVMSLMPPRDPGTAMSDKLSPREANALLSEVSELLAAVKLEDGESRGLESHRTDEHDKTTEVTRKRKRDVGGFDHNAFGKSYYKYTGTFPLHVFFHHSCLFLTDIVCPLNIDSARAPASDRQFRISPRKGFCILTTLRPESTVVHHHRRQRGDQARIYPIPKIGGRVPAQRHRDRPPLSSQ